MSKNNNNKLYRCMGNPKNKKQCQKCKRLPEEKEDEDTDYWYNYRIQKTPCKIFVSKNIVD